MLSATLGWVQLQTPNSESLEHTVYCVMKEHWKCRTCLCNSACICLYLPTGNAWILHCCKIKHYEDDWKCCHFVDMCQVYKVKIDSRKMTSVRIFPKIALFNKVINKTIKWAKKKKITCGNIPHTYLSVKWPVTNEGFQTDINHREEPRWLVGQNLFPDMVKGYC